MSDQGSPATIDIERRVEWHDTDAAGHHHHSAVLRWAESAEGALLRRLDLSHLRPRLPRVHYEVDYRARLWVGDLVRTSLAVASVGRSSLTLEFTVARGTTVAAVGKVVVVHTGSSDSGACPWDPAVRAALLHAGPLSPEQQRG